MPDKPTYPGVYVQESPSGVRTITGVGTSVTAFAGTAIRGPINQAVRILSFGEFEREFGGLAEDSEMSYAVRQFFANGGTEAVIIRTSDPGKGLLALDGIDFNLLCLPGISDPGIVNAAGEYCTQRRAFLIVDGPPDKDKPGEIEAFVSGPGLTKTSSAAIYYPWLKVADPLKNGTRRAVPPSGTIAGLYARSDSSHGVWKAPAGTGDPLVGVEGTAYPLTDAENGTLNPRGINCIRVFPVYGAVAWGARTLLGDDQMGSEWKYVPVRRTALFIEESLYRGLKWVVFEPNDEPLWGQIRLNVGAFMHNLFRQQAFQGTSPRDAYFVKCDKDTTTQNDINLGIVNIIVGFAPLKPAEFVMVKIQQIAGQTQS